MTMVPKAGLTCSLWPYEMCVVVFISQRKFMVYLFKIYLQFQFIFKTLLTHYYRVIISIYRAWSIILYPRPNDVAQADSAQVDKMAAFSALTRSTSYCKFGQILTNRMIRPINEYFNNRENNYFKYSPNKSEMINGNGILFF